VARQPGRRHRAAQLHVTPLVNGATARLRSPLLGESANLDVKSRRETSPCISRYRSHLLRNSDLEIWMRLAAQAAMPLLNAPLVMAQERGGNTGDAQIATKRRATFSAKPPSMLLSGASASNLRTDAGCAPRSIGASLNRASELASLNSATGTAEGAGSLSRWRSTFARNCTASRRWVGSSEPFTSAGKSTKRSERSYGGPQLDRAKSG
jgi:hypothetical protein